MQDDIEIHDPLKGVGVPKVVMDLTAGHWKLKVVPWIGGRIISMVHNRSGNIQTPKDKLKPYIQVEFHIFC